LVVDILETKVELEDPLPVRQVRELYKECTATGRILTTFLAALHTVQVRHTATSCMLYLEVFCIMLVKKEMYIKLRSPLIGKNLRTRECTNIYVEFILSISVH